MPRYGKTSDLFALIGAVASLVIALAGAAALRERARPVDVITVVAGVVGAAVGLAVVVVRRRRTEHAPHAPQPLASDEPPAAG